MTGEWVQLLLTAFAIGCALRLFSQIIRHGRNS